MSTPDNRFLTLARPNSCPPLTLADARAQLSDWDDLSPQRRKNLAAEISGLARICGLPENGIELSCPNLNKLLYRPMPASLGFTALRFAKLCSSARVIMRRLGLHVPDLPGYSGLSEPWKAVHDTLTSYRQRALIRFMGFCSELQVEPSATDSECLDKFELYLNSVVLHPNPAELARLTASNWNWARRYIDGWPQSELRRAGMRQHLTFPLDNYPSSFQADVQAALNRLAGDDEDEIYSDDVRTRRDKRRSRDPLKPRTLDGHVHQIRRAAAALIHLGAVTFEDLHLLRDLMEPFERVKIIRRFYRDRHGTGPNAAVAHILETLSVIARRYCKLPAEQIDTITNWATQARPGWNLSMTEKNKKRLAALVQPEARAMLQHFPAELMRRYATAKHLSPLAAARLAAYAVALEILLVFPMRRSNLASLRLDQHLQWLNARQPVSHIFLSAHEMKGKSSFQWPLPEESSELIELYLKHHRPVLAAPGNQFLFPGPGLKGRSAHELAIGLCKLIGKLLGLKVNLHLLRHFAGWVYLTRNPGAYGVLQQILGHRDVRVTMGAYAGLEMDAAAKHFDAAVLEDRTENRAVAQAGFQKRLMKQGTLF